MTSTITGTIHHIGQTETIGDKGTTKRIVVVKTTAPYQNLVPIEVYKEPCKAFDQVKTGQSIAVEVEVGGREWQGRYYASIRYVGHVVKGEKDSRNFWEGQDRPEPAAMPQDPSMGDELPF